jgi:hypothetical protein
MSLMDKVKEQAAQALNKAQHGVSQGKAKIDEAQAKHHWDGLLRNLGAAVYAEQREGGSSDAVTAALTALDLQAEQIRAAQAESSQANSPHDRDGGDGRDATAGPGSEQDAGPSGDTATEGEGTEGEVTPEA